MITSAPLTHHTHTHHTHTPHTKQRILVDELVGLTNTCVIVRVVNFTAAGAKYRSVTEEQKGVMQTNISNYQVTY